MAYKSLIYIIVIGLIAMGSYGLIHETFSKTGTGINGEEIGGTLALSINLFIIVAGILIGFLAFIDNRKND